MISIIIPCYNSEKHISETLNSIINQKMDNNFYEILLVDDGSTDHTLEILLEFEKRNPNIVKVFAQENKGVSAARNFALTKISKSTEIVTFIDSDDKISPDFLLEGKRFFDKNPHIKLAVEKIMYFGSITGNHGLNFRFSSSENFVNIFEHPEFIHFNLGGTFFKREIFNAGIRFDCQLNFWEDALLINTIILNLGEYGLIKKGTYYYRKSENSLVDMSWRSEERYTTLFNLGYQRIFNESKKIYYEVIDYIQYAVVYHMKLFFNPRNQSKIDNQINIENFTKRVHSILIQVKDYNIVQQRYTPEISSILLEIKKEAVLPKKIKKIEGLNKFFFNWDNKTKSFYIKGKIVDEVGVIPKIEIFTFLFFKKKMKIYDKNNLYLFSKKIENYFSFDVKLNFLILILAKKINYKSNNINFSQEMRFYKKMLGKIRRKSKNE